ncbi:hypothetical protein MSL71_1050 [Desulfoluna butyratoxydans]|uniref:Uncharacterized protein n=1 Tax=Desulfoluna butyratoxydans TaxID=231438 RepID=A0A4U8YH31_9BACT|nr:hypothetical protein MSL71_1050 [Desulfoluna butyratoxydans]
MCSHNTKEQISHYMNGIIRENLMLTTIPRKNLYHSVLFRTIVFLLLKMKACQ